MRTMFFSGCLAAGVASGGGSAAAQPDLTGVWQVETTVKELRTVEGDAPPLRADAAKAYNETRARLARGDLSFDPATRCISPGLPRMLYLPYPFQIIQRPQKLQYLFQWNYWNRSVDLTGKPVEIAYPLVMGYGRGRWEGDTLVIETTGLRTDNTTLDAAGLTHSDSLRLTERLRLSASGRELEDRIRFDDPKTFTRPWETVVKFRRLPADTEIAQDVCLDRVDAGQPAVDYERAPATQ